MNNNRLSTCCSLPIYKTFKSQLDLLIKSEPLIDIDSEGRAKKYIRSAYIIKAYFLNGSFNYFTNRVLNFFM